MEDPTHVVRLANEGKIVIPNLERKIGMAAALKTPEDIRCYVEALFAAPEQYSRERFQEQWGIANSMLHAGEKQIGGSIIDIRQKFVRFPAERWSEIYCIQLFSSPFSNDFLLSCKMEQSGYELPQSESFSIQDGENYATRTNCTSQIFMIPPHGKTTFQSRFLEHFAIHFGSGLSNFSLESSLGQGEDGKIWYCTKSGPLNYRKMRLKSKRKIFRNPHSFHQKEDHEKYFVNIELNQDHELELHNPNEYEIPISLRRATRPRHQFEYVLSHNLPFMLSETKWNRQLKNTWHWYGRRTKNRIINYFESLSRKFDK